MIRLKVKSRFGFRNGDYIGYIVNGRIQSVFDNPSVARSTAKAMEANKEVFIFDNDRTITQTFPQETKEQLLENSIALLESAKKHLYPFQKLSWVVENED